MEQPNSYYINTLSAGDEAFKQKLIDIIKKEFPKEKNTYLKNMDSENYKLAAENVHKIKHKISILGLENSYKIASQFEFNLLENNLKLKKEFKTILEIITSYLKKI